MSRICWALLITLSAAPAAAEEPAPESATPPGASARDDQAKQDAIYQRPFIVGGQRAAVGGYFEANANYSGEEGIDSGPSFELRRFNIFLYSAIGSRLRFLSELEFEHGTAEIALETALLDAEIAPELVLRAGILLSPLGAFNQAHDGPIWDFVERPLVSTTILPATFSEVGAGAHGTLLVGPLDLDYQLYLTQGIADGVVDNDTGRTSVPAGRDPALFESDNNHSPAVTGRVAARYDDLAELGLSGWRGAYNTHVRDGEEIDDPRSVTLAAVDASFSHPRVTVRGEAAWAWVELPPSLIGLLGEQQWGLHIDVMAPVWSFELLGFDDSTLNVGARFEHVDYYVGQLPSNGDQAGDDLTRITGALSLRPGAEAVIRLNYSYQWRTDLVNNAPARGAAIQLGVSTYF